MIDAVCFTGHRPDKLGGYESNLIQDWVRGKVADIIHRALNKGYSHFICGGALGFDWIAATEVIDFKRDYSAVKLTLALPFKGYNSKWNLRTIELFENEVLPCASEVVYVCDSGYAPWKMQKRNEWMVDRSRVVIACWNGSEGGTANAYRYAKSKGRVIYWMNPDSRTEGWDIQHI